MAAAGSGTESPQERARRLAEGGAFIALWWSVLAIVACLALLSLIASIAGDHGSYCESIDHPDECPNLEPATLYALTGIAGAASGIPPSVRYLRRRRAPLPGLPVTVTIWAGGQLVLGVWAAVEDTSTRLSAPGRGLLLLAVVHATVCAIVAALVARCTDPSTSPRL